MTFVKLAGPAKIGGKWRKQGEIIEVSSDTAAGLEDQGLVSDYPTELTASPGVDLRNVDLGTLPKGEKLITVTEEQFHIAVAAQAEALAGAVADAAMEGLENQTRRAEQLDAELADERVAHGETRARLEAALSLTMAGATDTPAQPDTPEPPAAKTAPKKGATAKG